MGKKKAKKQKTGNQQAPKESFNTPFSNLKLDTPEIVRATHASPNSTSSPPKSEKLSDNDLFTRAMAGSAPVSRGRKRVEPAKLKARENRAGEADALVEFYEAAGGEKAFELFDSFDLSGSADSGDYQAGAAYGVNKSLIKDLRNGEYPIQGTLDLHGYVAHQAQKEVSKFIRKARSDAKRCVLIITGKGTSSPSGSAVLKPALPQWLSEPPIRSHVLAWSSATPEDGGSGALYVLLRKSAAKKRGA